MARKSATYTKIPGRWLSLFARRMLWQGPDHLLWVENNMMQEHYRRFYYKDIQALIVRRNRRQHLWSSVWGVLVLLFGAMSLLLPDSALFTATLAIVWGVCLLVNLFKGPCCEVYLQTAVQLERLTTLVRERSACKTADRIKALCEKVQGGFQGRPMAMTSALPAAASVAPRTPHPLAEVGEPFKPLLHWILFSVVGVEGALGGLQLWLKQSWLVVLGLVALAATMVLAIVALVHWHRQIKGSLLAIVSWLTLVLAAAHGLYAYILFIVASMRHPDLSYNYMAMLNVFLELHLEDQEVILILAMGFTAASLALGVVGLAAVALHASRHAMRS
ncbi:MAG: hypothetical protein WAU91_04795 [Desulfatitalea sp.]